MSNHQRNQYAGNNDQSGMQDHFTVYIRNMLSGVPATPPDHSIFRVRHQLREVNVKAYEPEILAIGPYHNGNDKFKFMEVQKLQYLEHLRGRNEGNVNRCMTILSNLELRARNCYAETIVLSPEEFLAMMLIDGCFIVELFRKHKMEELRDKGDPVMDLDWIQLCLPRDLLLLENQIPFFILNELYERTKGPEEHSELIDVAAGYFDFKLGDSSQRKTLRESKHLLNLMHTCWTSGLPDRVRPNHRTTRTEEELVFMSSATKLRESGVRFKVAGERQPIRHPMDIKFKDGILEIPVFIVQDHTESQYRNLIAYEQHRQGRDINYFTDYVTFMDCLINSSKDVEWLCWEGIIQNYLGDDEVVAQMFNKIGDYVTLSNFYYNDLFHEINKHCKKRWNRWIAKLRREHLHSPWALLSIFAATMLLLLSTAQTVFAILSYGKDKKD